jgi:hypothetical protein
LASMYPGCYVPVKVHAIEAHADATPVCLLRSPLVIG